MYCRSVGRLVCRSKSVLYCVRGNHFSTATSNDFFCYSTVVVVVGALFVVLKRANETHTHSHSQYTHVSATVCCIVISFAFWQQRFKLVTCNVTSYVWSHFIRLLFAQRCFFPCFRLIFAHSFASFGVLRANVIVQHDYFNGYVNGIIRMGLTVRNTIEAYQYKAFNWCSHTKH